MAFDRKQYAGELQKRVKESHDTKDQGLFGGSIFKPDANLPMWKCTEGKHYIDVVPYIAGPNHPRVKEGKVAHNLDIWVHYQIGPNNLPFVCLAKNYNQPCPICDYRKELEGSEQADEDVLKLSFPNDEQFITSLFMTITRKRKKEFRCGMFLISSLSRRLHRLLNVLVKAGL